MFDSITQNSSIEELHLMAEGLELVNQQHKIEVARLEALIARDLGQRLYCAIAHASGVTLGTFLGSWLYTVPSGSFTLFHPYIWLFFVALSAFIHSTLKLLE